MIRLKENIFCNAMWVFIFRVIKLAWQNFYRNIGLSLITILVLVTTLISFDVILIVRGVMSSAISLVENRIDVSIIFKTNAPEEKIRDINDTLKNNPAVASLRYKDRNQVLEEFKKIHSEDTGIISALSELSANPLGAVLVVRAKNTKDYEEILKSIEIPEYNAIIEQKTFDDHGPVIQKINLITQKTQQIGLILSLVLTIVAFLIIFNVIRLSIIMHGEEIEIMKLVGASNWFVRMPFLIEVIFLAVLSWIFNLGILYGAIYLADPYLVKFFEGSGFTLQGYLNDNFLLFMGGELLGLIILNLLSTSLAMRKYLKA